MLKINYVFHHLPGLVLSAFVEIHLVHLGNKVQLS